VGIAKRQCCQGGSLRDCLLHNHGWRKTCSKLIKVFVTVSTGHSFQNETPSNSQDARIKELETSIKKNYADDRAKSEEHERKRNDSSRKLLEKQGQLEAVKKSHEEQLQQAEGKLLELEAKLDRNEQERRQLEWSKEDVIGDKEKEVGILKMKLEKQGKDVEMKLVDGMNERSSELKRTKDYLKVREG
jgi:hypothetical protein